jgi:hypothetical protein
MTHDGQQAHAHGAHAHGAHIHGAVAQPDAAAAPRLLTGVAALIAAAEALVAAYSDDSGAVIDRLGEDFAFIRWADVRRPLRFLRQMEGAPPLQVGQAGFRRELVDDQHPARHYMAFVVMGYHLPWLLAVAVLWLWEVAGFVRYGGKWSQADMRSGYVGIRHGRAARQQGAGVLPGLMARDLTTPEALAELAARRAADATAG